MNKPANRLIKLAVMTVAATSLPLAYATDYPSKPIKIVIPYSAGGGTDQFLRIIAPDISKKLGANIVIDNKPGASTMIGANAVKTSPPDGYTLVLSTSGTFSLTPYTIKPKPYEPSEAFDFVGTIGETAMVLSAGPAGPKSFREFVDLAKKEPGKITYSTSGAGNVSHLAGELLQKEAGISLIMVPYKGVEGSTAVAAGHVNVGIDGESAAGPLISGNKLQPLAVLQQQRSRTLPDTPALKELGFPNSTVQGIRLVLAAPKGTPENIISKLNAAFTEVLKNPENQKKLESVRTMPLFVGPKETGEMLRQQADVYEEIYKKNGLEFSR